jgi:tRNA (uracil-5-)-methyltransferase
MSSDKQKKVILIEHNRVAMSIEESVKRAAVSPSGSAPGSPVHKKQDTAESKPMKKEKQKKKRKYKNKSVDPTSPAGVFQLEIEDLLHQRSLNEEDISNDIIGVLNDELIAKQYNRPVSNVEIISLTSNGEGIGIIENPVDTAKWQIVIVPFAIPGDVCNIRVFKTHPNYIESDLLEITTPSIERNDDLIRCRYFGKCSGCQYQELPYSTQLEYKRRTVRNAYELLAPELVKDGKLPEIGETVPSPKEVGYRTKLTPHFDIPRRRQLTYRPNFGFGAKGKPTWRQTDGGEDSIVDIEECVIGTPIINIGMANERRKFEGNWSNYKKGATVLLREHTRVTASGGDTLEFKNEQDGSRDDAGNVSTIVGVNDSDVLVKSCVTNARQIVTEYINGFTFEFSAGEFFQNNNSILPSVTEYVCSNLQIPRKEGEPLYLVDAYCGSGLFSITASKGVDRVVGVDVSKGSIKFATKNAERNGVENATFIDGQAEKIFSAIDTPSDLTSVIIDPSRKGCDEVFLNQLSDYRPARVVYVSCNVHSQARDIQWFLNHTENGGEYRVESIRGFDFFPQTHHVEGVAVLTRV